MNSRKVLAFSLAGLTACVLAPQPSRAQDISTSASVAVDSRIKTLVYSENEVYTLATVYGYQSNIEFGYAESIETISLGDQMLWEVTPLGRRLFVRPLDRNARTNMTVITNRRAYQFDLRASSISKNTTGSLSYVIRFYYPDDELRRGGVGGLLGMAPSVSALKDASALDDPTLPTGYNFQYTLTGDTIGAPVKVFDDGRATYFEFASQDEIPATIAVVQDDGLEVPANFRVQGGYVIVDKTAGQFALRSGSHIVCVFNETKRTKASANGS